MSYASILNDFQTVAVDGPYLAIGMRRPGETNGVWLLGENHEKSETLASDVGFKDSKKIRDVVSAVTDNTILMFEGFETKTTRPLFREAPAEIKSMVSSLTYQEDMGKLFEEGSDVVPESGRTDRETHGSTLSDSARELLEVQWSRDSYWEFLEDVAGYPMADAVGETFASKGGVAYTIEDNIRSHLFNGLRDDKYCIESINPLLESTAWALTQSVPPEERKGRFSADFRRFFTPSASAFHLALARYFKHHYVDKVPRPFFVDILKSFKYLVESGDLDAPKFFDDDVTFDFVLAFSMVTMDMKILRIMEEHPAHDFVSYCGAMHCLNQMVILMKQGYVMEHMYVNHKDDFIYPGGRPASMPVPITDLSTTVFGYISVVDRMYVHPILD